MGPPTKVFPTALAGLLASAFLVGPARAQGPPPTRVIYNRPSAQSASQRMDRIGGRYTQSGPPAAQRPTPGGPAQLPTLATMAPPRVRSLQGGYTPAPRRLGLIPSPDYRSLFRTGTLSEQRIAAGTGYLSSIAASTPLYGRGPGTLPLPDVPLFDALTPQRDEFHEFFDLVPSREALAPPQTVPFESLMTAVEENTDADVSRTLREAIRLFQQATGAPRPDGEPVPPSEREELLRRAIGLLAGVRDLAGPDPAVRAAIEEITQLAEEDLPLAEAEPNREAVLANLLLVHAYLERYRPAGLFIQGAIYNLLRIAREDPEAFRDFVAGRPDEEPEEGAPPPTLASYFGDYEAGHSETLERQMRQYLRMAAGEATSPELYVFQAYCALALGDPQRARTALDHAEAELEQRLASGAEAERWRSLIAALRYAL